MPLTHWTDDDVQRYLDGGEQAEDSRAEHLRFCDPCRRKLNRYRSLYRLLAVAPEWTLRKDFASATAAKALKRPPRLAWLSRESVWIPAGLVLGIGAWWILVAPDAWLEGVQSLWTTFLGYKESLREPIRDGLSRLGGYLRGVVFGACVLAVVAWIDGFLLRMRHRRSHA
jgi:hypothetical protein